MNDVKERLKLPALALIVVGVVNALIGILAILQLLIGITKGGPNKVIADPDQRLGYMVGFFVWPLLMFLGTLISPFMIYAGSQMYAAKRYAMARLGAILALIPVTSCCFVLGIPAGIWALVILSKPEVKALFDRAPSGAAL